MHPFAGAVSTPGLDMELNVRGFDMIAGAQEASGKRMINSSRVTFYIALQQVKRLHPVSLTEQNLKNNRKRLRQPRP